MKKKNKKSKKQNKARKLKLAQQRKSQGISRMLTILILGVIGFTVYADVSADELESKYLTDKELLILNDVDSMDADVDQLEAEYKDLPKQIVVCWSAEKQRLVPVYMGCK